MSRGLVVALAVGLVVLAGTTFVLGPASRTGTQFQPSFEYGKSYGCFDMYVYSVNRANTELLSVQVEVNPKNLPTQARPLVIMLDNRPAAARVQIDVYETDNHNWPCSDVGSSNAEAPTTWVALSGTLSVVIEPPTKAGDEYQVTVRISDAEFSSPMGARVRPPRTLEIKTLAGGRVGG